MGTNIRSVPGPSALALETSACGSDGSQQAQHGGWPDPNSHWATIFLVETSLPCCEGERSHAGQCEAVDIPFQAQKGSGWCHRHERPHWLTPREHARETHRQTHILTHRGETCQLPKKETYAQRQERVCVWQAFYSSQGSSRTWERRWIFQIVWERGVERA